MATIDDIISRAQQVRDNTAIGSNTATLVGGVMKDTADHVKVLEETPPVIPDRSVTPIKTNFMDLFNGTGEFSTYYNSDVAEIYIVEAALFEENVRYAFKYTNNYVYVKSFAANSALIWSARVAISSVQNGVAVALKSQTAVGNISVGDVCAYIVVRDKTSLISHDTTSDSINMSKDHVLNLVFAPTVAAFLNRYIMPANAVSTENITDGAVTPLKTSFFVSERLSQNLCNPEEISEDGYYIRTTNGKQTATTTPDRRTTGYIPIDEEGLICNTDVAAGTEVGMAYYAQNKTYISGAKNNGFIPYVEGAAFVRLTISTNDGVMCNKGSVQLPYEAYSDETKEVIDDDYLPDDIKPSTDPITTEGIADAAVTFAKLADGASMEKGVGINLPTEIVAVVGRRLQIFHRSVVQAIDPYIYDIEVSCNIGNNYPRYFSVVPTTAGTWTMTYYVRRPNGTLIASKSTTLRVVADLTAGATLNKSILIVGASVVNSGFVQAELKRMMTTATENTQDVTQVGNIYPKGKSLVGVSFVGRKSLNVALTETYINNGVETEHEVARPNVKFEATGGYQWHTYVVGRKAFRFQLATSPSISLGAVYTVSGVDVTIVEVNGSEITGTYESGTIPATGTLTRKSGSGDSPLTYNSYSDENYSPFSTNGVPDFAQYADNYCDGNIDVLVWHIGTNDVFQNSQTVAEDMRTLIDAFHADFPNGKAIISSPPLVDPRGGLGYSYGASSTYYWGNLARRYYALWQVYDDFCKDPNYSPFVKFAHTGIMMDIENAYKYSVVNVNTRLAVKELRGYNGAHPADCGCFQIADGIYNTLITL